MIRLTFATLLAAAPLPAQVSWSAQLATGSAYSAPMTLAVRQAGAPELRVRARYSTRPFRDAPYYAYRFARWASRGDGARAQAWELELVHHKIYLENPPAEVQHFEVSHGYNLVTVNRAARHAARTWRAGAGAVVSHGESTVRGRTLQPVHYHLAGPALQLAADHRTTLGARLYLSLEGKLTAALARVPIAGGLATAPNVAVHGLVGIGVR